MKKATQTKNKEPSILQRFPDRQLDERKAKNLGYTDEDIEVFPPEVYFKGNPCFYFERH
jgi:hypothetical protein